MQAHNVVRTLKWVYFAVLLAATGIGVWAAYPYIRDYRTTRASPLAVDVYGYPFVSIFSDAAIAAGGASSLDTFFTPAALSDATGEILQRRPAPLAKDADRDAWTKEFASDLTASLNNYMSRRYRDSLERLEVSKQAKGQVLVRIENVGQAQIDEVRVEVPGGQLFMEGPPTPKLRSLGTRATRLPTIAPGEKLDLFVLTTQDVKAGGAGPNVQVSSKGQAFPVTVHTQDAPTGPSATLVRWIASGTLYLALILAGLGLKARSLGVRLATPATPRKRAAPAAPFVQAAVSPPAPVVRRPPAEPTAWQRPSPS